MQNDMRDRLRGLLLKCGININTTSIADHLIENDVVPVVRCKDCKHFITDIFNRTICNRTFTMFEMNENDYCSYGKGDIYEKD